MTRLIRRRDAIWLLLATGVMHAAQKCPLKDSDRGAGCDSIDVPIALTPGTTRTPEFPVRKHNYLILLRYRSALPFTQTTRCLVGGLKGLDHCEGESLLKGTWRVWARNQVLAQGEIHGGIYSGGAGYNEASLGNFVGEKNERCRVEITLSRDLTGLKVADPRLVIDPVDDW